MKCQLLLGDWLSGSRLQAHRHCCLTWIFCVKWNMRDLLPVYALSRQTGEQCRTRNKACGIFLQTNLKDFSVATHWLLPFLIRSSPSPLPLSCSDCRRSSSYVAVKQRSVDSKRRFLISEFCVDNFGAFYKVESPSFGLSDGPVVYPANLLYSRLRGDIDSA